MTQYLYLLLEWYNPFKLSDWFKYDLFEGSQWNGL